VLLRYLLGDIVALSHEPCPICGREGERVVTVPRRTGSLVKCRGMLVNTELVVETLSSVAGIGQFQIVFRREEGAMDSLVIRIEGDEGESEAAARLREQVMRAVREAVSLRPDVEFVRRGELYDHERAIKAKRVVDLRTTE
jgi:phenylacetate-coenzyme A ligase PaaK-like adenylate-forming protein